MNILCTDKQPYNDVGIRRSLFMAIDWEAMNNNLDDGKAQIITYPDWYVKGYEPIYMDYYTEDTPADIKELPSYKPEKAKHMKMTRELLPYIIKQCWVLGPLRYPSYVCWWPWVKNYSSETCVGYAANYNFVRWIWVDQELKKSIGH